LGLQYCRHSYHLPPSNQDESTVARARAARKRRTTMSLESEEKQLNKKQPPSLPLPSSSGPARKNQKSNDDKKNNHDEDDDGRKLILTSSSSSSSSSLMGLPLPIRVSVFNFLDQYSLIELTLVSKQCHDECNNGPGIEDKIIPVIEVSGSSTQTLLQNLRQHQQNNETYRKLQLYPIMRVKNIQNFDAVPRGELERLTNNLRMEGIVSLDISLLSSIMYNCNPRSLLNALSGFHLFPNLREINLSNAAIFNYVLHNFSNNCPQLEKVTWNNINRQRSCIHLDGIEMRSSDNLKEIIMDGSDFFYRTDQDSMLSNLENHIDKFIFHCCRSKALERVSIRNAKWFNHNLIINLVPQNVLLKFVRNAPSSLRWFRSDLTQENMDMLRLERPEIELLN
jgi:hypothetical protein